MKSALYCARYHNMGGSKGVVLPPKVRELLQFKPGDWVVMQVVGIQLVMRRLIPDELFDYSVLPVLPNLQKREPPPREPAEEKA
jgi:bifunctional DNA-binding transcriptional regulator/antitoxin component of YhaV-PrlF toxin-antitoxin module